MIRKKYIFLGVITAICGTICVTYVCNWIFTISVYIFCGILGFYCAKWDDVN